MNIKVKKILVCFALLFSCLLSCFISAPMNSVFASNIDNDFTSKYTNVLDDLKTNSDFVAEDYSVNGVDYSLQVIDIAESSDKELFIYVYQPSSTYANLIASTINIATSFGAELNYINYRLTLLNSDGVFYKYLVNNFVVSSATTREYEITSIYRLFDKTIDSELNDDNSNTINEVNYKVAKHWTFGAETSCQDIETITITDKYVGYVRYKDGDWWHLWGESACDRHFVAFSTDRKIDTLMEADIYYQSCSATYTIDMDYIPFAKYWTLGNISDGYANPKYSQKGNYDNGHYNYNWDRIQNVNDFIASVNISNTYSCGVFDVTNESVITDENVAKLKQQQWVLSFLETKYEVVRTGMYERYMSTRVSNVSILRLAFETDGKFYNLGVIDNKQTGSDDPINDFNTTMELNDMFKIILSVLLLIVLIVLLAPILPSIFSFLWAVLKMLLKIIWTILTLPFKIVQSLFNTKKRK